jgi:hypothetical protein
MTEQPAEEDDDYVFLSPVERYSIFNEIYDGRFKLNLEDELFQKSFNELESENTSYRQYLLKLKDVEEQLKQERREAAFKLKQAEEKLKQAEEKLKQERHEAAERKFFSKAGPNLFEPFILKQISNELGPLLFEFVNDNLTPAQKDNVIGVIRRVLGNDLEKCNNLLGVLGLNQNNSDPSLFARSFKCETDWSNDSDTETMSPFKESLDQYTQLAMCFELKDPELEVIVDNILDPVKTIFRNGTFKKPRNVHHYSAIIGPSFMGKTQFSFILARIHPVFYFNFFVERENPQNIYSCFNSYSDELLNILSLDTGILSKTDSSSELSESENLFHKKDLKLFTIGFIWSLIEHSMEFDFSRNDGKWFNHFLETREVSYIALSFNDFYDKMGKIGILFCIHNLLCSCSSFRSRKTIKIHYSNNFY